MFDRIMWEVKREFDFGAREVGAVKCSGRLLKQMVNCDSVVDLAHNKHGELSQIKIAETKKLKLQNGLTATEMDPVLWWIGMCLLVLLVGHCCPQFASEGENDKVMPPEHRSNDSSKFAAFQFRITESWVSMTSTSDLGGPQKSQNNEHQCQF